MFYLLSLLLIQSNCVNAGQKIEHLLNLTLK